MAKCLNKDPLKRATVDELLNDPFVNGVDAKDYLQNCKIAETIQKFCTTTNCLTSTTIKSSACMLLAGNMSTAPEKEAKRSFDQINKSKSGLITRDELIQLFLSIGYSYGLIEDHNWCDDLVVAFGERMISKDCDCFPVYTVEDLDKYTDKNCTKHEIEGISFDGFKQFWHGYLLLEHEAYRNRIFAVFDDNGDGYADFNELLGLFGHMSFEHDMDEIKKSRVTGTGHVESTVRRMIREIDKTGDGMISIDEFNQALIG